MLAPPTGETMLASRTRPSTPVFTLALFAATAACGADPLAGPSPDPQPSAPEPSAAAVPIVVSGGFALPESAEYDPVADVYLVSNIGEGANPLALDGDGYISRIAPDGTVVDWRWIDGADADVTLHGPFGLHIEGDVLYAVDRDALRAFDRATGDPLGPVHTFSYSLPFEAGSVAMLNDVCVGNRGDLFVTDTGLTLDAGGNFVPTGSDAVYRIENGSAVSIVAGEETAGPNGCLTLGSSVVWTTFKADRLVRAGSSGREKALTSLPAGQLDSAVRVGGSLYVSSWEAGGVFRVSLGGSNATLAFDDLSNPGDLGFDSARNRLLVPLVFSNELRILPL